LSPKIESAWPLTVAVVSHPLAIFSYVAYGQFQIVQPTVWPYNTHVKHLAVGNQI